MKLEGRVASVTGGARGNGFAAAKAMAQEGANIVIADICEDIPTMPYPMFIVESMMVAVEDLKKLGVKAIGVKCDVRKSEDVQSMVNKAMEEFSKIDILDNNAGNTNMAAIADMEEEAWDDLVDTHLRGTFLCCRYVLPNMIEEHYGKVINISSVGGLRGFGMGGHYCAAKHGIVGLTKSIAMEVADHNINVNVICPGTIWTPMMAGLAEYFGMEEAEAKKAFLQGQSFQDREITPEDVGRTVVWLASEENKILTGSIVTVDAGWTCRAP
jgi:NAD(P)-dependent dehydrogenase (short-subunit alcohol dehydrogenase family)